MFEQKKKVGTEGKGGNAGGGSKRMPVCYTTQKQEHFSLLNNTLQSFHLFICLLLHSELPLRLCV